MHRLAFPRNRHRNDPIIDAAILTSELERASTVIDSCGERARQDELVDLSGLDATVEGLCQAIMGLPETERTTVKPHLIDLIDPLNNAVGALEAQRTTISDDIRGLSSRYRAMSAYGKGAKTSPPLERDKKP